MENKARPLTGVKVVACSTAQAGTVPYMLMADLGAEVIKVEVPGTCDRSRTAGELKGQISSFFETNNRGEKEKLRKCLLVWLGALFKVPYLKTLSFHRI